MGIDNLGETQEAKHVSNEEPLTEDQPETPPKKRSRWPVWVVVGLFGLLVIGLISAGTGYRSGIGVRTSAEATQVAVLIQTQFDLGLKEMSDGQYFRARQRFEYVAQLDPNYPGLTEKLAEALMVVDTTATPTVVLTPTLTPTPDLRNNEELFSDGQQAIYNGDWDHGIDTLLQLRKIDPEAHKVDIDGLLFVALRNRGWDKISKMADLEGGIYDLTLAERFAPLDSEAKGMLTWSSLYLTGASFWDLDWAKVVEYFAQVAPQMPGLRDGSGMTSTERYRIALGKLGDTLASTDQWCEAQEQYELSLNYGADAAIEESLGKATDKCEGDHDESSDDNDKKPAPTAETQPTEQPPPAPTEAPPAPTEAPPAPTDIPPTDAPPAEPSNTPGP